MKLNNFNDMIFIMIFLAPNVYTIKSKLGDSAAPAFTMTGRNKCAVDERVKNPGPGAYNNVNPTAIKSQSPSYTMGARHSITAECFKIPGPGNYRPEKVD